MPPSSSRAPRRRVARRPSWQRAMRAPGARLRGAGAAAACCLARWRCATRSPTARSQPTPPAARCSTALHRPAAPTRLQARASTLDRRLHRLGRRVLEAGDVRARRDAGGAQVVITPLARAMLRPFAAVVFPGADDNARLGARAGAARCSATRWRARSACRRRAARASAEALAFAQLLRAPQLTLLRRRTTAASRLAPSPLVERAMLAWRSAGGGRALDAQRDPVLRARCARRRPRGRRRAAARCCPAPVSASACEALRACPYRFFALRVLRAARGRRARRERREARLRQLAACACCYASTRARAPARAGGETRATARHRRASQATRLRLDAGDFLPYRRLVRSASRRATWPGCTSATPKAARCSTARSNARCAPPALDGIELHGVIDRIDRADDGGTCAADRLQDRQRCSGLKQALRDPLEDTQLAFYAALLARRRRACRAAIYLALDERERHRGCSSTTTSRRSAAALLDGVGRRLGACARAPRCRRSAKAASARLRGARPVPARPLGRCRGRA